MKAFRLYFVLLAAETVGAAIVLVEGVPIYRQIVGDISNFQRQPGILWWAIASVVLIQVAYWLRVTFGVRLPRANHQFAAHVLQFAARLSFIFPSATFTVVFLARFEQLSLPPHRLAMVLLMLFSLFCYSQELDRLGRALSPPEETARRGLTNETAANNQYESLKANEAGKDKIS